MAKKNEEVRDGYFYDIPEDLRTKILNIHKIVVDTCRSEFKLDKYNSINNTDWAKNWLETFLTPPSDKSIIGWVRVYRKGKRYRAMIQLTGHVNSHRNTEEEELFHGFIRNVHTAVRSKVRRLYDMTLTCESIHGEPFEGFDLWTKNDTAKMLWEYFDDKKIKRIIPMKESGINYLVIGGKELPLQLHQLVLECNANIFIKGLLDKCITEGKESLKEPVLSEYMESTSDIGYVIIRNNCNDYFGEMVLSPSIKMESIKDVYSTMVEEFNQKNPGKELLLFDEDGSYYFGLALDNVYTEKLYNYLMNNVIEESSEMEERINYENAFNELLQKRMKAVAGTYTEEVITESAEPDTDAKKLIKSLTKNVINDINSGKKISQYTVDTIVSIINKNLLSSWCNGYKKLSVQLMNSSKNLVEFKIPNITDDFISRFIEGRETINGLLHRNTEIKMRVSTAVFDSIESSDDIYNFFRAAIKHYDSDTMRYSNRLMPQYIALDSSLKQLICTTSLSGLVSIPLQMLFVFDDVHVNDKNAFKISNGDIKAIINFTKNIYSRYKAPEKEKKAIINDLNTMIKSFNESFGHSDNFSTLFIESVDNYFNGAYDNIINDHIESFHESCEDKDWIRKQTNPEIKYLQEKFGVKKLKKIPSDLVAYITIETEAIKDANDKMMIASYCISKIEIVEWYIELLEVGSKKYIVPHSKPYLENVHTQLLACYKNIMNVKIKNPNDRPLIDIKYPADYEG